MRDQLNYCPIPLPDGSDCWRPPEPDGFANICREHMLKVARAWVGDPEIVRPHCPQCGTTTVIRDRLQRLAKCIDCGVVNVMPVPDLTERSLGTREPKAEHVIRRRTDVVYYLAFGNRIKIGTTTNLPKRLAALPFDQLLAVERGNATVEYGRHAQFRRHLVPGQREWFNPAPDLVAHAKALREQNGPPMAAWDAWSSSGRAA